MDGDDNVVLELTDGLNDSEEIFSPAKNLHVLPEFNENRESITEYSGHVDSDKSSSSSGNNLIQKKYKTNNISVQTCPESFEIPSSWITELKVQVDSLYEKMLNTINSLKHHPLPDRDAMKSLIDFDRTCGNSDTMEQHATYQCGSLAEGEPSVDNRQQYNIPGGTESLENQHREKETSNNLKQMLLIVSRIKNLVPFFIAEKKDHLSLDQKSPTRIETTPITYTGPSDTYVRLLHFNDKSNKCISQKMESNLNQRFPDFPKKSHALKKLRNDCNIPPPCKAGELSSEKSSQYQSLKRDDKLQKLAEMNDTFFDSISSKESKGSDSRPILGKQSKGFVTASDNQSSSVKSKINLRNNFGSKHSIILPDKTESFPFSITDNSLYHKSQSRKGEDKDNSVDQRHFPFNTEDYSLLHKSQLCNTGNNDSSTDQRHATYDNSMHHKSQLCNTEDKDYSTDPRHFPFSFEENSIHHESQLCNTENNDNSPDQRYVKYSNDNSLYHKSQLCDAEDKDYSTDQKKFPFSFEDNFNHHKSQLRNSVEKDSFVHQRTLPIMLEDNSVNHKSRLCAADDKDGFVNQRYQEEFPQEGIFDGNFSVRDHERGIKRENGRKLQDLVESGRNPCRDSFEHEKFDFPDYISRVERVRNRKPSTPRELKHAKNKFCSPRFDFSEYYSKVQNLRNKYDSMKRTRLTRRVSENQQKSFNVQNESQTGAEHAQVFQSEVQDKFFLDFEDYFEKIKNSKVVTQAAAENSELNEVNNFCEAYAMKSTNKCYPKNTFVEDTSKACSTESDDLNNSESSFKIKKETPTRLRDTFRRFAQIFSPSRYFVSK